MPGITYQVIFPASLLDGLKDCRQYCQKGNGGNLPRNSSCESPAYFRDGEARKILSSSAISLKIFCQILVRLSNLPRLELFPVRATHPQRSGCQIRDLDEAVVERFLYCELKGQWSTPIPALQDEVSYWVPAHEQRLGHLDFWVSRYF
jgi:hypothetical protein